MVIDQLIWIQETFKLNKKAGSLRAEFGEIPKLFTRQSPQIPTSPAQSPIAMREGISEGKLAFATAKVVDGEVVSYQQFNKDQAEPIIPVEELLQKLVNRVINLENLPESVKAKLKGERFFGADYENRIKALLNGKTIKVVEGNDRLMHFTEGPDVITIDIDALMHNDLLFLEFIHELLHAKLAATQTRAGPSVDEENQVTTQEVELFLVFPQKAQANILEALKADNDLDDQEFYKILEKAQAQGIDAVKNPIHAYITNFYLLEIAQQTFAEFTQIDSAINKIGFENASSQLRYKFAKLLTSGDKRMIDISTVLNDSSKEKLRTLFSNLQEIDFASVATIILLSVVDKPGFTKINKTDRLTDAPKVLLVGPYKTGNIKIGQFLAPPLGAHRIASFLEVFGIEVDVYDTDLSGMDGLEKLVKEKRYDFIGFSMLHPTLGNDIRLMYHLKKLSPESIFIAGGQGASFNYDLLLNKTPADIVVRGFGEFPMLNFAASLDKSKDLLANYRNVRGIYLRDGDGKIIETAFAKQYTADDMHVISLVWDISAIPYEKYWQYMRGQYTDEHLRVMRNENMLNTVRIYTESHCPMGCTFCSSTRLLDDAVGGKQKVILLSAEDIIKMIKETVKAHPAVTSIYFNDDNFMIKRERVAKLCDLIEKELSGHKLNFFVLSRVDMVDYDILKRMQQVGFKMIIYGAESFSNKILEDMEKNVKGQDQAAMAIKAVEDTVRAGLIARLNLILFYPTTRLEDIKITIDDSIKLMEAGAIMDPFTYVEAYSGAKIVTQGFEIINKKYSIEDTGQEIEVPDIILPQDPVVREVARKAMALKPAIDEEIKSKYGWKEKLPAPINTLALFKAIYLSAEFDVAKIDELIDKLILTGKETISPTMSAKEIWQALCSIEPRLEELKNFSTWPGQNVYEHTQAVVDFEYELDQARNQFSGAGARNRKIVSERKDAGLKTELDEGKISAFLKHYYSLSQDELKVLRIAMALHDIGKIRGRGEDAKESEKISRTAVRNLVEQGVLNEKEAKVTLALIYLHTDFNTLHFGEGLPNTIIDYLEQNRVDENLYYKLAPVLYIADVGSVGNGKLSDDHLDNAVFLSSPENIKELSRKWDRVRVDSIFRGDVPENTGAWKVVNFFTIYKATMPVYVKAAINQLPNGGATYVDNLLEDKLLFGGHAIYILRYMNDFAKDNPEKLNTVVKFLYLLSKIADDVPAIRSLWFTPTGGKDKEFAKVLYETIDAIDEKAIENLKLANGSDIPVIAAKFGIPMSFDKENAMLTIETQPMLSAKEKRVVFTMIKPDAIKRGEQNNIIDILGSEYKGIDIVYQGAPVQLTRKQAEEFYIGHRGQPHYEMIVQYIMRGPVIPMLVRSENEDAVDTIRTIVGPTKGVYDDGTVATGTIRGDFMTDADRRPGQLVTNGIHASDAVGNVPREFRVITGSDRFEEVASGGPLVMVGVAEDAAQAEAVKKAAQGALEGKAEVIIVKDKNELAQHAAEKGLTAIFVDKTFTPEAVSRGKFKADVYAIELARIYGIILTANKIDSKTRDDIATLIKDILGPLAAVDFDKALSEFKKSSITADKLADIKKLKTLLARRKQEIESVYNGMPMPIETQAQKNQRIVAITEKAAMPNMFFGEDMTRASEGKGCAFIYGDIFRTENDARQFVADRGYAGQADKIKFINKKHETRDKTYEEIVAEIAGEENVNVGVIDTAGELKFADVTAGKVPGTLLEIQPITLGDGQTVYVAINSFQILLKMMLSRDMLTTDDLKQFGVIKDSVSGIFKYLPRALPIDYEKEVRSYMEAIEVIRTAA